MEMLKVCFVLIENLQTDLGIVSAKDKMLHISSFINPIKSNPTLVGKPKLFFIQGEENLTFFIIFFIIYKRAAVLDT